MAEPGDPQSPDDHDDLIGFASPASLQGRVRTPAAPEPAPEARPEPEPDLFTASVAASIPVEPDPAPAPATPDPAPTPIASVSASIPVDPEPDPAPAERAPPEAAPSPAPVAADSIFEPSPGFSPRPRRSETPAIPGGGMGLYAVYALILFAIPTLGVSALIGLLAVTGRAGPDDPTALSHFLYQQRTLWTAAVAVAVGLIFFLVPFGLGPAIMFLAALWLVVRGAAGVWALKAGRPIADPRGWWI
ncbi:hypothetical protein [Brevundimonas sp.]|uniref:hypothetical protein n=1 Tax=Brevundimonas sp. TaxID=1871086 RepID=UPI002D440A59|nr:hypothetical protein [Brevundimonas sp.]HYD28960.1 hypothetical protein [Brevundimonas sp.]